MRPWWLATSRLRRLAYLMVSFLPASGRPRRSVLGKHPQTFSTPRSSQDSSGGRNSRLAAEGPGSRMFHRSADCASPECLWQAGLPQRCLPPRPTTSTVDSDPASLITERIARGKVSPPDRLSSFGALHEHPPMALDVLGAIALAVFIGLDVAEDGGAPLLCPPEVLVHVIDVDKHAVHDIGHGGPLLCRFAFGPMPPRGLVVGRGRRQHDDAVTTIDLDADHRCSIGPLGVIQR